MRKLIYYIGVSLDGRIAGPGDEVGFFPLPEEFLAWIGGSYPETLPTPARGAFGLADVPNRSFDTVVMGLGSYKPGLDAGLTSPYAHLRQYVVSSTLDPDIDPEVAVVQEDPLAFIRDLKDEDGLDIWLCGGGKLAGVLLSEIDELAIKTYPVVAGAGVPMVDGPFDPTLFDVVERTSFPSGITFTRLSRADRP